MGQLDARQGTGGTGERATAGLTGQNERRRILWIRYWQTEQMATFDSAADCFQIG